MSVGAWLVLGMLASPMSWAGDITFSEAPDVEGELLPADPEAAAPPAAPAEVAPAMEEVEVWGRLEVKAARTDIVRAMRAQGWEPRTRRGELVFVGPESWMGKARFDEAGFLEFSRPVVAYKEAGVAPTSPWVDYASLDRTGDLVLASEADVAAGKVPADRLGAASPAIVPTATFYVLPNERKLASVQVSVLDAVGPHLTRYRAVLDETAFREELDALPDRLDALWTQGVPLSGGAPLDTPAARRAHALAWWATRESSPRGLLETERFEDWFVATVMTSESPATPEELAQAASRRADGRRPPGGGPL